jgi:hypothetical protein
MRSAKEGGSRWAEFPLVPQTIHPSRAPLRKSNSETADTKGKIIPEIV